MAKLSKRRRAINEKVEAGKVYQAEEAFSLLKRDLFSEVLRKP